MHCIITQRNSIQIQNNEQQEQNMPESYLLASLFHFIIHFVITQSHIFIRVPKFSSMFPIKNSILICSTSAMYSSPLLIKPTLLQYKNCLIIGVISHEGEI